MVLVVGKERKNQKEGHQKVFGKIQFYDECCHILFPFWKNWKIAGFTGFVSRLAAGWRTATWLGWAKSRLVSLKGEKGKGGR
jgi:hypothetical protein